MNRARRNVVRATDKVIELVSRRPSFVLVLLLIIAFLGLVGSIILLGLELPRCSSNTMPCPIDEPGGCLCALRGSDGSCWQRMAPALQCYSGSFTIQSGICLGYYETKLCAQSQADVDNAMTEMSSALFNLHPNSAGTCNVTILDENVRCSLPLPRLADKPTSFFLPDCCRPPLPTCASDVDCCNCGQESPTCAAPLQCMVTSSVGNISQVAQTCLPTEDACISFYYTGCDGSSEACLSTANTVPISGGTSSDCCNSTCTCRTPCQEDAVIKGCPCVASKGGCVRKMCVQTSAYFAYGGVAKYLSDHGAEAVQVCSTNLCNR